MGILRRRPPPLGPEPRPHHYTFAHRLLPEVAATAPDLLLTTLVGRDGEGYLRHLWQLAGDGLAPEQVLEPVGLGLTIETLADSAAIVVTLPTPENAIEARFVALVEVPGSSDGDAAQPAPPVTAGCATSPSKLASTARPGAS